MEPYFCFENPAEAPAGAGKTAFPAVAIQPCISAAGWPAEAGSRALAGFVALEDSAAVSRLRGAGIPILGEVRTSEFGFGLLGGAAGRAVAAKAVAAELMLDTAGESRAAAAKAGVFGFKAGCGTVSRRGLIGLAPSMEAIGVLAENPAVIRNVLAAVSGPDEKDFSLPDDGPPDFSPREIVPVKTTIGVVAEARASLSPEAEKAFRAAADELRLRGFTVADVSVPGWELFSAAHRIVASVEASSSAGRYDSVRYGKRVPGGENWNEMYLLSRGAAFGPLVKNFLLQGAFFQFERYDAYENACRIRARVLAEIAALGGTADFLMLPPPGESPAAEPGTLDGMYDRFAGTLFANVAGLPALFLPPARGGAGFQLAAQRLRGPDLIALGEYLHTARRGG